ncbi:polysaccharide pyruvyl transferase family protein [Arcobacter sp. YIC-310]|uniref:polysaccharide pyruvyl transferase family protein n=1 Tax=Arcobacter sp. YIC-310 TaxID=3376632 RepID=UPI003C1E06E6
MKIAIITVHRANNYGAVLQAYATQKVLSEIGESKIIDYNNRYISFRLDLIRYHKSLGLIANLKFIIHDILRIFSRYKAVKKFNSFISSYMNLTNNFSSKDLIDGKANGFDVYVCGSDQIWNPEIATPQKKIDANYFLKFVQKGSKKLSYASSFGHHKLTGNEQLEVKELLNDFDLVSVREKDAKEMLESFIKDKEINHVLDPTLLLNKQEWLDTFELKEHNNYGDYILLYTAPRSELLKKAVAYFSKKLGLKVISIDQSFFPLANVDIHIKDAGPKEFIDYFANAKFIITDSFHGVCFSINFRKSFVAVAPGKKSNRLTSLLSLLNLDTNLVSSMKEFEFINCELDYLGVDLKLFNQIKQSKEVLFNSIKN